MTKDLMIVALLIFFVIMAMFIFSGQSNWLRGLLDKIKQFSSASEEDKHTAKYLEMEETLKKQQQKIEGLHQEIEGKLEKTKAESEQTFQKAKSDQEEAQKKMEEAMKKMDKASSGY